MIGPLPLGRMSDQAGDSFGGMERGRRYAVRQAFTDFDGHRHDVGESWIFLGAAFLPYDDGQSLFVSPDGEHEWHIRLQWRAEEQGAVLDAWSDYCGPAT